MAISIMRAKMVKGGLFIQAQLMHQKFQWNGIIGYILHRIELKKFKDLSIKSLKCKNSEFDDNPEITAYIQVRDLTNKKNDEVFVFNGWMFSSSPSIEPFDHPVYDVWLVSCY